MQLVTPESVGMSSERLARIDRFLDTRYVANGKLPFVQLLIARDGQLAHRASFGEASLETGERIADDAIVRIYSMTKPITSVAFMMLVEEGKVALDDPVERHIPSWAGQGVYRSGAAGSFVVEPAVQPVRMIDLLRHTAGLTYGFQMRTEVDAAYRAERLDPFARADGLQGFVDALGRQPLEFEPGSAWNYSVATDVLGYLVERLSGVPFADFLRQRIFEPLGMVDTGFHVPAGQLPRLASCYARDADGRLAPMDKPAFVRPPIAPSGGGGLVSTAADYLRFCEMLRRGGRVGTNADPGQLIGPKTLALMRMNHLPGGADLTDLSTSMFSEAAYRGIGFGLGFAVTTDVAATGIAGSNGEYFWGGMASTAFWIDPVEQLSVVFLTQLVPSSSYPVRRELRTLVNAAILESRAAG